jgi:diadenosine tetraphosphate (Ap4A) HIT family hydrolase
MKLHPQLERDCHTMGRLPVCQVLLHRNAALPWWILVPDVDVPERVQVEPATRSAIDREVDELSRFVLAQPGVRKLNIAAIGNVVPQLHIHVVGRHPGDPCWPRPVWGHLDVERSYTPDELTQICDSLAAALDGAVAFTPEPAG